MTSNRDESGLWAILREAVERAASTLGRGLPAEVHADAVAVELEAAGVPFERRVELRVAYGGRVLETPLEIPLMLRGDLPVLFHGGHAADAGVLMSRVLELGGWRRGALVSLEAADAAVRVRECTAGEPPAPRRRLRPDARKGAERLTGQPPRQ